MARDGGARSRRRTLQLLPRPGYRRRPRYRAQGTNPCASIETKLVAVQSQRRAVQAKRQAATTVDLQTPVRGVRGRQASRNHRPGMAHRSRKDRPSARLDHARPRFPFLALFADVEAATRLDDPDHIGEALSTPARQPHKTSDWPAARFFPTLELLPNRAEREGPRQPS